MSRHDKRIIGSYEQGIHGPLFIVFGGMHGNEPSGILAMEEIFRMLEREPETNPDFEFKGKMIGIKGNVAAIAQDKRFIIKDLNRQFTPENLSRISSTKDDSELDSEDKELRDIVDFVQQEIEAYDPQNIVFLDLHTTTAFGGIFSIPTNDPESERIAVDLHAPVIRKLINGIQGTTLHYFNKENFGRNAVAVTFESGQHDEALSTKRAIAALTNCMSSIGCIDPNVVENKHHSILIEYSKGLPKIADLLYCHPVNPEDNFVMKPGYKNFQHIQKGEVLAKDKNGEIASKNNGRILMPLYQKQGEDGFFIIKTIEEFEA